MKHDFENVTLKFVTLERSSELARILSFVTEEDMGELDEFRKGLSDSPTIGRGRSFGGGTHFAEIDNWVSSPKRRKAMF